MWQRCPEDLEVDGEDGVLLLVRTQIKLVLGSSLGLLSGLRNYCHQGHTGRHKREQCKTFDVDF